MLRARSLPSAVGVRPGTLMSLAAISLFRLCWTGAGKDGTLWHRGYAREAVRGGPDGCWAIPMLSIKRDFILIAVVVGVTASTSIFSRLSSASQGLWS